MAVNHATVVDECSGVPLDHCLVDIPQWRTTLSSVSATKVDQVTGLMGDLGRVLPCSTFF